jgi:hypothetical protein
MVVCKRQQGEENALVKSAISVGTREAPWIPRSLPSADSHAIILPGLGQEVSHFDAIPRVKLTQEEASDVSVIFMCGKYKSPHYFNADSSALKKHFMKHTCS